MELWTFQRYQSPRLVVDAIHHEPGSALVSMRAGAHEYRLAFDASDAADQIAAQPHSLTDTASPPWWTLRESDPDSGWHALGTFLDTHSLIGEADDTAADALAAQAARMDSCIAQTVPASLATLGAARRDAVARDAATLRLHLDRPASARTLFDADDDPFDAQVEPNFHLALLCIEFEYFRRAAPLPLAAVALMLDAFSGAPRASAADDARFDTAGLYDEPDLMSHLWLVASSLVAASGEDAQRLPCADVPAVSLSNGLEFMRQTELITRETLNLWGENPYVSAVDALNGGYSPLVAGPFIEQYHVTRRFVEIIAPLLSMRLSIPLRTMMFRYYGEESGHEALESTTCEALGVAPRMPAQIVPLPLHFAFVDALTLLADVDPVSSFAAIMVVEGIFGEPPKMSLRLMAAVKDNDAFHSVSGDHEELNESLNHNSISRDTFEQIAAIDPVRQTIAMRRILFLLELNPRAWSGIAGFYGAQPTLALHGPYGRLLDPRG
ncbi:hypothetical protein [Burkholderia vietnamiensis]|uniref:hypothetical protein n=1 Tax=Burkholderia vietnamiensis TaxID=60552 RepID=UPI000D7897F9|nr:hypothetical protein [Burkholderia vietnamiensis]GBH23623.1 hypothetical protein BvRS1_06720 [Burkholderia vietnamiensis]